MLKPSCPVSVILTVFEREKFLATAIGSVLRQTFRDYEIIVSDDSNLPAIRSCCESFQRPDLICYRSNPSRLGAPLNIRAALQEAKGRYIAILNDDDFWERDFLEKLVPPLAEDPQRVIAFSDHWIMDGAGKIDQRATDLNSRRYRRIDLARGDVDDPARFVLDKNGVPLAMAALFRQDALDLTLLRREVAGAYDLWLACALAATGGKFYYLPERLTRYRVHPASESARSSPDKSAPMIFIFDQLLRFGWFPEMRGLLARRLAEALHDQGRDLLSFGERAQARCYFQKALKIYPHWKATLTWFMTWFPERARGNLVTVGRALRRG